MDVNLFAQKISWRRVQTFEGHADESSQRQSGYNDEARDVVGLDRMDIHTIKGWARSEANAGFACGVGKHQALP